MSLIIAIKCSDGIIVGSDSAVTIGGMLRDTIRQYARKITVLQDSVLIACAGFAGLSQRYVAELDTILKADADLSKLRKDQLLGFLQSSFTTASKEAINSLAQASQFAELSKFVSNGLAGTIVAMKSDGKLELFCFDEFCNGEEATDEICFISLGSGRGFADPFLAYLKRVLWRDEQPTLSLGMLATVWTLKHAIEVNPGGIGGPLRIYQMTLDEAGDVHVEQLDDNSVEGAEARISDIELRMREIATQAVQPARPMPTRRKPGKKVASRNATTSRRR